MTKPKALLLGCGNSRERRLVYGGKTADFSDVDLTTLDMDPHCGADVVMDFDNLGKRSWRHPFGKRLPFADETFDELASYDVLEHIGRQGDWRGFFLEFGEYHRILKPGGTFGIIVPLGEDALADPGHTRFFQVNYFGFLSQSYYEKNLQQKTTCTDYRWFWKKDFEIAGINQAAGHHIGVILRRV